MWHPYVSKLQLYIKGIFASPKWLNNGILLLRHTSWLQGGKEVLLGLLFWFGDLLSSPRQRRKWVFYFIFYIGKSDFMVPGGLGLL